MYGSRTNLCDGGGNANGGDGELFLLLLLSDVSISSGLHIRMSTYDVLQASERAPVYMCVDKCVK